MTSEDAISAAVERLAVALETRVPCAAVRDLIGTDDLAAAYAVQQGLVQRRLATGATVVGRKIGATSEAVQRQLGVDQPDFGYLLDVMDVSDEHPISMQTLLQPRVEAEVAFVMATDVNPADEADITIELVRERRRGRAAGARDRRLADRRAGTSGSPTPWPTTPPAGSTSSGARASRSTSSSRVTSTMSLTINGEERSSGNGAACLGDPLEALRWLAVQCHRFGDPLRAGQVVLSGALGPFVPFAAGDKVEASISGFEPLVAEFKE